MRIDLINFGVHVTEWCIAIVYLNLFNTQSLPCNKSIIRGGRECLTSYCCVQTPFAKYRGKVTLFHTQIYHKRLAYNHALVLACI